MQFPKRVNLVYGERWLLTARKNQLGLLEVASPEQVLNEERFRKSCDFRWILEALKDCEDYLVRCDHHPRNAIRAGIPLVLERRNRQEVNHRWRLVFLEKAAGASSAFRIVSTVSGMHLVVVDGALTLTREKPKDAWLAVNAEGQLAQAMRRILKTQGEPTHIRISSKRSSAFSEPCSNHHGDTPPSEDFAELQEFPGDIAAASARVPRLDKKFTAIADILTNHVEICAGWELPTRADCRLGVEDVFREIYSRGSPFMEAYQQRRQCQEVEWEPPEPHLEEAWCAAGRLRGFISVPVLGRRAYDETQLTMLCRSSSDELTLAYQQVGSLSLGWPMGSVDTEVLFLYTNSPENSGNARLRVLAPTPPETNYKETLLKGTREAFADFQAVVTDLLARRTPGSSAVSLELESPPMTPATPALTPAAPPKVAERPVTSCCCAGPQALLAALRGKRL